MQLQFLSSCCLSGHRWQMPLITHDSSFFLFSFFFIYSLRMSLIYLGYQLHFCAYQPYQDIITLLSDVLLKVSINASLSATLYVHNQSLIAHCCASIFSEHFQKLFILIFCNSGLNAAIKVTGTTWLSFTCLSRHTYGKINKSFIYTTHRNSAKI